MQDQQQQQQHLVCKDYMQIMKGKRTKRQRLAISTSSSVSGRTSNENSLGFDLSIATTTTTSPTSSIELFRNRTEEEEDMANCLILLAQGNQIQNNNLQKASSSSSIDHNNNNNKKSRLYLYQCKTCNKCFSSFQALGGHRTSHKKASKEVVTTNFVNQTQEDRYDPLTLQLSSKALYRSNNISTKSKVHECSICGAEFTSGQALGGHMRRHRNFLSTPSTLSSLVNNNVDSEIKEEKKPRDVLNLDLNLPAQPEDHDHRESKFPFQSRENVLAFSATSLVDCHY